MDTRTIDINSGPYRGGKLYTSGVDHQIWSGEWAAGIPAQFLIWRDAAWACTLLEVDVTRESTGSCIRIHMYLPNPPAIDHTIMDFCDEYLKDWVKFMGLKGWKATGWQPIANSVRIEI